MTDTGSTSAGSFEAQGGWTGVLSTLTDGGDLGVEGAQAVMEQILAGAATPAQIAGVIVALRMKGESIDEMTGMVRAMQAASVPINLSVEAIDVVGTGGSPTLRKAALNVSTMASFVVAGSGVSVCKHGNRKASSTSGSFDVLEALGVNIEITPEQVSQCVAEAGVGFCFARAFHPAMRHAGPVRVELGVPTVFNVLGPLSNPARVTRQVVGVADGSLAERMIGVLANNGSVHSMVVHGTDGLDELSTTAPSNVFELRDGEITQYQVDPGALGIRPASVEDLVGGDADRNAEIVREVLGGAPGAHRDIVLLNAAAGLVVGGRTDDLAAGLEVAAASIDEGKAAAALDQLVAITNA
ncbi:MAG: anthranilate phosphoribosyltransferase [Actinomycetia bacterium]|nr:anthranilate phosphoribosyltransferase [Actinomycetes bacterium]MCP4085981.1 anthranilate phosphoribosyltransferase [Actinomycetes bacterium]